MQFVCNIYFREMRPLLATLLFRTDHSRCGFREQYNVRGTLTNYVKKCWRARAIIKGALESLNSENCGGYLGEQTQIIIFSLIVRHTSNIQILTATNGTVKLASRGDPWSVLFSRGITEGD